MRYYKDRLDLTWSIDKPLNAVAEEKIGKITINGMLKTDTDYGLKPFATGTMYFVSPKRIDVERSRVILWSNTMMLIDDDPSTLSPQEIWRIIGGNDEWSILELLSPITHDEVCERTQTYGGAKISLYEFKEFIK